MPPRQKKVSEKDFMNDLASRLKEQGRLPNLKDYRPHEPQFRFHSSKRKKKLYIGGNRSGKTTGGVVEDIWRAVCRHPYRPDLNSIGPNLGRVCAVDFDHGVGKIILPQFKQWTYPSLLVNGSWEDSYDKATKTFTFANGSTIELMSYDQDLDKFAGVPRHWIHFDEEPPKPIYDECLARLVDYNGDHWVTMTPVEGMTWIYDELYEGQVNNPDGIVEVIEVNTLENPYLPTEGVRELVKSYDKDQTDTRIGGSFVRQGGRVYKNFDPTPGGIHVLSDPIFEPAKLFPQRNWLWIMGLDHGLNNPTAVLWMAIDPNGFCIVFDEYYQKERTIDQNAAAIKEKIRSHGRFPDLLIADPSIQNRNPVTGTSVQEEYQRYGLNFILGNNDVRAGIVRVKKYFNPHPYVGQRKYALEAVPANPGKDAKDEITTIPMLRFSPECSNTIWELKRYRWKTYANKRLQYENNPYDEPHKKDDHACDALRYIIMNRPDLHATNGDVRSDQIDGIMAQIEEKIAISERGQPIADPNNLRDPFGSWSPNGSMPSPAAMSSNTEWQYDEHFGNLY